MLSARSHNGKRNLLRRLALLVATIALSLALAQALAPAARAAFEDYDFDSVSASVSTTQAGAHPDFTTFFRVTGNPAEPDGNGNPRPWQQLRDFAVELPEGLSGNPAAYPQCNAEQFFSGACATDSQIGVTVLHIWNFDPITEPVYNMTPPGGDVVARLGFVALLYPAFIDIKVDPERGNAVTAKLTNAPALAEPLDTTTTLWGVPSDPSHDAQRLTFIEAIFCGFPCLSDNGSTRPSGLAPTAFMTNPTSCGPKQVGFGLVGYSTPNDVSTATASLPDIVGCESVPFDPSIALQPTTQRADSPSGMKVNIHVPQFGLTRPNSLATAHLKKAVVTLPEGMAVNPSAADGLEACTEAEIGLVSADPIRFNAADPACPDGSKVGTVKIDTPVLKDPVDGSLYLADQDDNPFDALLSGYLVAQGQGLLIKLAGRFDLDPQSGRVTATFDNNPQQPFSELELRFRGGNRSVLVTPPTCGVYQIESELAPWSAADPDNPTPDEIVSQTSSFTIDRGPDGGPCLAGDPNQPGDPADRAQRPFAPQMSAGTVHPFAGQYSPFVLRLTRRDGEQEISRLQADLPPGLVGRLAGIPYCPDAALAQISSAPGTGAAEKASPHCPAAAKVGRVNIGAGAGSTPFYIPGSVYLAGPYAGAPLSLAVVAPAVAGPFDLGNVVVRTKLTVDPDDAQVHVDSGPLPTILEGIPLHVRDIRVVMDRRNFTLNPTNCDPMALTGRIGGAGASLTDPGDDTAANVADRFQVGGCAALDFGPRFITKALGKKGRGAHPTFRTIVTAPAGGANIRRVVYKLPKSLTIDQRFTIGLCTETELARSDCATARVYGRVVARTPLLSAPLSGPLYLVSGSGGLPRLAMILRGPQSQPIKLVVRASTYGTRDGGYRTVIPFAPDAAVSRFTLTMFGSKRSIIQNTRNLCRSKAKGKVAMIAHNNMRVRGAVKLAAPGCKKKKRRARRR